MSGGSMDYLSYKVQDANFSLKTPLRKAFRTHLMLIADALHKIEWNDSGDGAVGEDEAIMKCIRQANVLKEAIKDAEQSALQLRDVLAKAYSQTDAGAESTADR